MRSVRLFDFIEFEGKPYQVVAQSGPMLALKSLHTNRIRHVAAATLLTDDTFEHSTPSTLPTLGDLTVLERLDTETRERTEWLYSHVYEVIYGTPPPSSDGIPGRPANDQYATSHRMSDRIAAKSRELANTSRPIPARTLRRHVEQFRHLGVEALVDGRKTRQSSVRGRQVATLIDIVRKVIEEQGKLSTGTRSRVITIATYRAREAGIKVPSKTTMYRLVAKSEGQSHPFGDATTRRTQQNRPDRTFGRRYPVRPGELVEIDSTVLDLMVLYPDGSTGRPELTTMIDVATRTLTAAVLIAGSTKGIDVAALVLAKSLTPLPMQPGWAEELALSRSILPAGMIEPDESLHDAIAARPVIYPETITMDRGKVFTGSVFMNACERMQISIIAAPPGTPTAKPHIERQFGSVHAGLIQYLDGYVGRNMVRRGRDAEAQARWTLSQVQSLIDQWTVSVWQNTPRKGLAHPAMPQKALTPNEMYFALAERAPTPAVALEREDFIALLPLAWRKIQAYGINFKGLLYDADELHKYRGQASGIGGVAQGKWEVRYDPGRLNAIFVRDHITGSWIEASWKLGERSAVPFSAAVLRAARKAAAMRDPHGATNTVLAEILRIQSGVDLAPNEKRAARRTELALVPELTLVGHDAGDIDAASEPPRAGQKAKPEDLPDRLM